MTRFETTFETAGKPGPYLVRSGATYLFQIKVPKEIKYGSAPIRMSLGSRSHDEARLAAGKLAEQARLLFHDAKRDLLRATGPGEPSTPGSFTGPSPDDVISEIRASLKSYLDSIVTADGPPPSIELPAAENDHDLSAVKGDFIKQIAREAMEELIEEFSDLIRFKVKAKLGGSLPGNVSLQMPVADSQPQATVASPAQSMPVPYRVHGWARASRSSVPAFHLDRRRVPRKPSEKPKFSVLAAEYVALRQSALGKIDSNIKSARMRLKLFTELIGDHPVDTYNGTDLQAYVELLQYWPGESHKRAENAPPLSIIERNRDLHLKPVAYKTLKEGYVAVVRSAMRSGLTKYEFYDPFVGAPIRYPSTAAPCVPYEPLSAELISKIFRLGVETGQMHCAMLPLLGHLTGRRLGLLVHLRGNDFRRKFDDVWVAQTSGIVRIGKSWKRIPVKNDASLNFFVLHGFLREIGFVDWAARRKDDYIFPQLMSLKDPSKGASAHMQRLFKKAGVASRKEVFHSLRGGNIEQMRLAKLEPRTIRMQAGHQLGINEHELYGFRSITESNAVEIATLGLDPKIDYSMFHGLNFQRLALCKQI